MRCTLFAAALLLVGVAASAQEDGKSSAPSSSISRRAEREARFRAELTDLIRSRHFRFMPVTMQNIASGTTRYIFAYYLYMDLEGSMARVHLPVEFTSFVISTTNFDSPVRGYVVDEVDDNWRITFSLINEGESWLVELFVAEATGQARLAIATKRGVMRYIGSLSPLGGDSAAQRSWGIF